MLGIEVLGKMLWELIVYGLLPAAGLVVVYLLVRKIYDAVSLPSCAACGRPADQVRMGRIYCRSCARAGDRRLSDDIWRQS